MLYQKYGKVLLLLDAVVWNSHFFNFQKKEEVKMKKIKQFVRYVILVSILLITAGCFWPGGGRGYWGGGHEGGGHEEGGHEGGHEGGGGEHGGGGHEGR
jgi:uncharacterized membrane protein YgcG